MSTTPGSTAPSSQEIHLAGGCMWGVQAFVDTSRGVLRTEAGRANGTTDSLNGPYGAYAECVRTRFDPQALSVEGLLEHLFEIIDPHSIDQQGPDVGRKYRTGVYSREPSGAHQPPDGIGGLLELLPGRLVVTGAGGIEHAVGEVVVQQAGRHRLQGTGEAVSYTHLTLPTKRIV